MKFDTILAKYILKENQGPSAATVNPNDLQKKLPQALATLGASAAGVNAVTAPIASATDPDDSHKAIDALKNAKNFNSLPKDQQVKVLDFLSNKGFTKDHIDAHQQTQTQTQKTTENQEEEPETASIQNSTDHSSATSVGGSTVGGKTYGG
jgi:hypothetical protein